MRIVIVVGSLGGGGAERQACLLYDQLRTKLSTVLISLSPDDRSYAEGLEDVVYLRHKGPVSYLDSVIRLRKVLRDDDRVVCFNWRNNLLVRIARPRASRFVRYGGLPQVDVGGGLRRYLAARVHESARGVIATSAGLVNAYLDYLGDSGGLRTCVPNAVDLPRPTSEPTLESPYVLAAGRLIPEKDHLTLLKAFALAVRSGVTHQLLIAGDGELRPTLEAAAESYGIAEQVRFLGFRHDVFELMSGAEMLVMSSTSEGFGSVLIESLVRGTPVVSTDAPFGPGEILHKVPYGILVPVGDVESLAKGISGLIDGTIELPLTGDQAAVMTLEHFGAQRMAAEYLELIEAIG